MINKAVLAVAALSLLGTHVAAAREYFVGGPVQRHDMEVVANYLVGVEMAPRLPGMPMGSDVIHLEADVHATADNAYGYPDGAWIGYLTIHYVIEEPAAHWTARGTLHPMEAKDGPHYADNVRMNGPGTYTVTYDFAPPDWDGFLRHVDKRTGVPAWWMPFSQAFTFSYPQK
ncbi:iron transporter [Lichenicoccus sp.]|uniref:iron transporter n=1 Tax=Lichenicoccus sp. TaxID=2781899 RepID=UPI003D0D5D31